MCLSGHSFFTLGGLQLAPVAPPPATLRVPEGWSAFKDLYESHLVQLTWLYSSQNASSFAMTAPTRLSGVDAPDVKPIDTGPLGGNQPVVRISDFVPAGRCLIALLDSKQSGSAT